MTIEYTLTKEALAKIQVRYKKLNEEAKKYTMAVRFVFPILALAMLFTIIPNMQTYGFGEGFAKSLIPVIVFVLAILFALFFPKIMERIQYQSILNDLNASWTADTQHIKWVLEDEQIVSTGVNYETTIPYAAISRVEEEPDHFYFRIFNMTSVVVPYTAFASEEEKKAFITEIRSKMNK